MTTFVENLLFVLLLMVMRSRIWGDMGEDGGILFQ